MARTRRFLAPAARQGDGKGYLSQPQRQYPPVADEPDIVARIAECRAMCDEPEAPSQAWVNAEAELAAERNRLRLLRQAEERQQARRHITIENRMKAAQNRAKLRRLDLTREFFVMRKMLDRGKNQDATVRLERLEARLDGVHDLKDAA